MVQFGSGKLLSKTSFRFGVMNGSGLTFQLVPTRQRICLMSFRAPPSKPLGQRFETVHFGFLSKSDPPEARHTSYSQDRT